MKIINPLQEFYNRGHLTEISKKGYYSEKIKFVSEELNKLSRNNTINILDIACNDGFLTEIYGKYGNITGIDINKKSYLACKHKGIQCINSDIKDLPKQYNGKYDVVIAGDIIEHIFDTDDFLEHIHRLLKKDGTLILTTANVASIGRRIMLMLGKNPFLEYSTRYPNIEINVGHIRYYTVADMYVQLAGMGYKDIKIYGDKINITKKISIPYVIARHLPNISRYMFVSCKRVK